MIRLAIFHSDFQTGGQQRSVLGLLQSLSPTEFDVTLFYFKDGPLSAEIPGTVKRVFIEIPPLCHFLPFTIGKYVLKMPSVSGAGPFDLAVDYSSYFVECAIGVHLCKARSKLVWIHTDMRMLLDRHTKSRLSWLMSKRKFKQYDYAVCVSNGAKEAFVALTKLSIERTFVAPNIIDNASILRKAMAPSAWAVSTQSVNFVFLGRLVQTKRVDRIIECFVHASAVRKDIQLYIIGDGPLRRSLEEQAEASKCDDRITFCGNLVNPYSTLIQMDCLVLLSEYEGQGIVIQEAKALGLNLLVAKHLEKYNEEVEGVDDVARAMLSAKKKTGGPTASSEENAARIRELLMRLADNEGLHPG